MGGLVLRLRRVQEVGLAVCDAIHSGLGSGLNEPDLPVCEREREREREREIVSSSQEKESEGQTYREGYLRLKRWSSNYLQT